MEHLQVVEHFISINGEGPLAGQLAMFIRFKGCNLACDYCDTKWANLPDAPATEMTPEEITDLILKSGVRNVTLTGGEPLWRDGMITLLELLGRQESLHIEIETNGSIPLDKFAAISPAPAFTMDYKLSCSGMESLMCLDNFKLLTRKDTVKFVVGSIEDCKKALTIIDTYHLIDRCHIYLSPVFGMIDPADIVTFMMEHRLNGVNLQIQMHKVIWDPEARGV